MFAKSIGTALLRCAALSIAPLAVCSFSTKSHSAEITAVSYENSDIAVFVLIEGPFEAGDADFLEATIKRQNSRNRFVPTVGLKSPGGLVDEGIAIGRILRKYRIHVEAPVDVGEAAGFCGKMDHLSRRKQLQPGDDPECMCNSACALAWFGGVTRSGRVGLHHSYLKSDSATNLDDLEEVLVHSRQKISDYLREMRVPLEVSERVFATPSAQLDYIDAFRVRTHNQNMTLAAMQIADRNSSPHRS
ncbi:hypothetical protein [Ruegeria profundi]|nr:hypothetical protein [Ruegeria profundi]MCA0930171.1 hypothetical protein [Ruegeria profundi]